MNLLFSMSDLSVAILALKLFTPIYAATPKVDGAQVVKHVNVLQELKNKYALAPEAANSCKISTDVYTKRTQTEAYLSVYEPYLRTNHSSWFTAYPNIIDTCLKREKELVQSHYVMYHGQKSDLCILQDVLKLLFETMHIKAPLKGFEIMRAWHEAMETINIDKYIANYAYNSKDYFCANLSLFGNHNCFTSCSFDYFVKNYNMSYFDVKIFLTTLFTSLNLDINYVPDIVALANKIKTAEGRLFQIFIPHEKIDQCVFLSAGGFTTYGVPIVTTDYDAGLGRHRRISPVLELYKTDPHSITGMEYLQSRVMCSKDLMLNPDADIRIYSYNTVEKKKWNKYQKNLKKTIDKMVSGWLISENVYKVSPSVVQDMPIVRLFNVLRSGGR